MSAVASASGQSARTFSVEGERWRLEISRERGTFDILVQPKGEREFVSVLRPGGERPWFGDNAGSSEIRTSDVAADLKRGKGGLLTARCVLQSETGAAHEASYYPIDEGVVIVSRFTGEHPADAAIVRAAPKLDVDTDLLTHYAFIGPDGTAHTGAVADLGERDAYAGVGGWGGGDVVPGLSADHPHMLLYNPERDVSVGIILPYARISWRGAQSFLQLYRAGHNFWYTGFLPQVEAGTERVCVLYLRQSGSPSAIQDDTPRVIRDIKESVRAGKIDAPTLAEAFIAQAEVEGQLPALAQTLDDLPPSRAAWFARLLVRAARDCGESDPKMARMLLNRARAELGLEE
jgi:hypothetical protein